MSDILLVVIALVVIGAVIFFKKKSAEESNPVESQPEPAKEESTPAGSNGGKVNLEESSSQS